MAGLPIQTIVCKKITNATFLMEPCLVVCTSKKGGMAVTNRLIVAAMLHEVEQDTLWELEKLCPGFNRVLSNYCSKCS